MENFTTKLTLLIIIYCFLFPPQATPSSTNQTDLFSLLAIKSSLQDPQGSLNSWNQTLHFCRWNGVQCGSRHRDRVVSIDLTSHGLVGKLSPHVGNLSFLRAIILSNNTFHGSIPGQITLLHRLEVVDLSYNSFTGAIPSNLSQCPNLIRLQFNNNFFSKSILTELGFLSKLEELTLSENKLSGPIPPSIGNISSLMSLSALSCGLSGVVPASLGLLRRLEFLTLSENNLTGIIPPSLFNVSTMIYFDVSDNKFHGTIPSTVGLTSPNLACLVLEQNQFVGLIPSSISNASLIEWIVLSVNHFVGPIPNLERLTLIQDFFLRSNLVVDDMSFISSLTNSTKLERFDVSDNMLYGSLPDSIANLSIHISLLNMYNNKISGHIPLGIGNLVNLIVFDLSNNRLHGPIPPTLSKLSNLHNMFLGRNRLTGQPPSLFGNMTLLSHLRLDENKLSGNMLFSLANCTNLLELDLSVNNFNGSIPPLVMSIPSVSIAFNLSHNELEGSVPYEVGSMKNLDALDLSSNRFSGVIPHSLSRCVSLQQLYLGDNFLDGELPSELSALVGLQELDLSKNNLSGLIPTFLGEMKLKKLNLSFNRLQGVVPTTGVFKNITSVYLGGNEGLCGGISELRLPHCSAPRKRKNMWTLLKVLIPVLVTGGIVGLVVFFTKCARYQTSSMSSRGNIGDQSMRLSYADLLKATGGFSESNLIASGRFGSVYKGILNDENSTFVATKVLNLAIRGASRTFMAECNALRSIRHRNLIKLLSVCDSIDYQGNSFKALVYEFKANGSLEKWLYSKEGHTEDSGQWRNLSMMQRLNIAIDVAKGIEYLHIGTGSSIVHGDLKPSNILLDQDMIACVGDFGLAKIVSNILPSSHETSRNSSNGIRGTLGYIPPEYGTSGIVSMQGDVYSYGIILLEMFTNKRPTDALFDDRLNLHYFVSQALPDRVMEIVDPKFQTEASISMIKECTTYVLNIGVSCSKDRVNDRMSITDVVNQLSHIQRWIVSLDEQ